MNASSPSHAAEGDPLSITRREAIKRTAMILGIAVSPSLVAGVLRAQSTPATVKGRYLTAKEFETAGAVAERIIPKTDTPGAIEVGVPAFIDLMYGQYLTDEEKRILVAGLAKVESLSTAAHQRGFAQLSGQQQDSLLKGVAEAAQHQEKTFFHAIRELTLLGYFTSEPVGKTVLHYDPIPGRYDPCVPLSEVGNVSWTR